MAGLSPADAVRWRWAIASEIGTSHLRLKLRKQDAARCFVTEAPTRVLCAIVCDGAGSAQFGGEGASLVCRTLSVALRTHFRSSAAFPTDDEVWDWFDSARDRLAAVAGTRSVERRAFASTVVMLVASQEQALVVHVGDGAVVARDGFGSWQALSWPENGEFASTTYFVTDDPAPKVRISRFPAEYDGYALFSDGIEDLALDQLAETPHAPFFRSMLSPLDALSGAGRNTQLSLALAGFLNSPRVCERTDDDKSLVLISCR